MIYFNLNINYELWLFAFKLYNLQQNGFSRKLN